MIIAIISIEVTTFFGCLWLGWWDMLPEWLQFIFKVLAIIAFLAIWITLFRYKIGHWLIGKKYVSVPKLPDELIASHLQGLTFRIVDLTRENTAIKGKVFDKCHIYGPALIALRNCICVNSSYEGKEEEVLVTTINKYVMGAILLEDCTIRDCTLHRIGIIGMPEQIEKIRQGFTKRV